jgi:hypothetical protein
MSDTQTSCPACNGPVGEYHTQLSPGEYADLIYCEDDECVLQTGLTREEVEALSRRTERPA